MFRAKHSAKSLPLLFCDQLNVFCGIGKGLKWDTNIRHISPSIQHGILSSIMGTSLILIDTFFERKTFWGGGWVISSLGNWVKGYGGCSCDTKMSRKFLMWKDILQNIAELTYKMCIQNFALQLGTFLKYFLIFCSISRTLV